MNDYWLLFDGDGMCRTIDGVARKADDRAIWRRDGDSFVAVLDSSKVLPAASVTARPAPARPPSAYLEELREFGFTVLDGLLAADAIAELKRRAYRELEIHQQDAIESDGRIGIQNSLAWSADAARALTNPVAVWLLESYLATESIHFCHPPGVTAMRPTRELAGTFPDEGWHSDYPYHPGVFPDDDWPEAPAYGLQFNLCVDAFTADNAATQYLPMSHKKRHWPPREFNLGGTRMGEGLHRDVAQMTAPAGAALVYDARMWHRACDELNSSDEDRFAILNAVAPNWVLAFGPKRASAARYLASATPALLTARERRDIRRFVCDRTAAAPADVPELIRPERTLERFRRAG